MKMCRRPLPPGEAAMNEVYYRYRRGATERGIDFFLTKEKFKEITSQNCHYCGAEPNRPAFSEEKLKKRRHNGNFFYNGIDRISNGEGYYFDNCVACCTTCNLGKHNLSYHDFMRYLERLVTFRSKKYAAVS